MKISLNPLRAKLGSTLMITALLAIVAGSTLVYVLQGSQQESSAVMRSEHWNNAMILAEAGIEEGMTFINNGGWPNSTTYAADGWTQNGNVFSITRVLDSKIGSYTVYVTNFSLVPSILAVGTAYSRDTRFNSNSITRKVLVNTVNTSPYPGGLTLQRDVDMNGKNVTVDSYDSTDPNKSYWTSKGWGIYTNRGTVSDLKRQANGNVATDGAVVGVLSVGNASVYGKVLTGPAGTVALGAKGSVGDNSWVPTTGIQPGYARNDMNVDFPAVILPSTNWTVLAKNSNITNSGNYSMDMIDGQMTIVGPTNMSRINVTLYVTNGINFKAADTLVIGTNAYVTIYAGTAIFDGGNGKGGINNVGQHPEQLIVWGLPSLTSIRLNGNGAFWGAIYAPSAAVQFAGGGNSGGFYGALTAYSIQLTGNSTFSYDESLGRLGIRGYTITSWQEIGY